VGWANVRVGTCPDTWETAIDRIKQTAAACAAYGKVLCAAVHYTRIHCVPRRRHNRMAWPTNNMCGVPICVTISTDVMRLAILVDARINGCL